MATLNPTCSENPIKRHGLTEVFRPLGNVHVDIVFVHGLNGHPEGTWTSEEKKVFWPAQLLPSTVMEEKARILVYGYNADVTSSFADGASRDKVHNHAEQLVAVLSASRQKERAMERPIIFVAHSLGGIVVKRALIYSAGIRGHRTSHLRSIFVSAFGLLFLGTPHLGSDVARWTTWLCDTDEALYPSRSIKGQSYLIEALETGSETLQNIDRDFVQLASKFYIYYFHEGKPTNIPGTKLYIYIVDEVSASPTMQDVERASIQQDHNHMSKFDNETSPGFDLLTEAIQRYASKALGIIKSRWKSEKAEQQSRKELEANELLSGIAGGMKNITLKDGRYQAIGETTDSQSISPKQSFYLVTRERLKNFLGRGVQLQEIASFFSKESTQRPKVLILHALGGQGKSQIALEYCQRSRDQYRGIFWINASSEASAIESYTHIAKALTGFTSATVDDGARIIGLVKNCLESWHEPWLLVFDNYDEPTKFSKVQRLLPKRENGHVLFTSRHGGLHRLGTLIKIPEMSPEESVRLLLRGNDEEDIKANFTDALEIVQRLGYLALAIDQAAAYIHHRRIPPNRLGEFLKSYDKQREQILSYTPNEFWEYTTVQIDGEEAQSRAINAFTTWEMSLEQLQSQFPLSAMAIIRLLTLSAFFNTSKIEEWLFRNHFDCNPDLAQWLRIVCTRNDGVSDQLVHDRNNEYNRDTKAGPASPNKPDHHQTDPTMNVRLKRKMKSIFYTQLASHKQQKEVLRANEKRNRIWDSDGFWYIIDALHKFSLLQDIEQDASGVAFSLHPLIRDWLQLREVAAARGTYLKESLDVVAENVKKIRSSTDHVQRRLLSTHIDAYLSNDERLSGTQHRMGREIADCDSVRLLAFFYFDIGRYATSLELHRRISTTREAILGKEHPETLQSMMHVAQCLNFDGKYRQAEQLYRQLLPLHEQAFGKGHAATLFATFCLGNVLRLQENCQEAERILSDTLQRQLQILGEEHSDTMECMRSLAATLSREGKCAEAEALSRKALQLSEKVNGMEHVDTEDSISFLADVLRIQGKYDEAEELYLRCLQLSEKLQGVEHPMTALRICSLGFVYKNKGKLKDAETMFRRALELQQKSLGKEHLDTFQSMEYLADVLRKQFNFNAAEELYCELFRIQQGSLGEEDPHTLNSTIDLAEVSIYQKKFIEAEKLLRRALKLRQKSIGKEHPDTLNSMTWLVYVLRMQDKQDEAAELDQEILELERINNV